MKNFHKSHQQWHKKSPITKKMEFFHEKIICLEQPKMQKKIIFFFLFGNPNVRGGRGGGQACWAKFPTLTKNLF